MNLKSSTSPLNEILSFKLTYAVGSLKILSLPIERGNKKYCKMKFSNGVLDKNK